MNDGKIFFSEEKKQKTFMSLSRVYPARLRVSVVILAAGMSSRMGNRHKLLLDVGGVPMIRRTLATVLEIEPIETVIVTGHDAPEITVAVSGLPATLVHHADFATGQPGSVASGVRALHQICDAVMIVPGDQAMLSHADLKALCDAYRAMDEKLSVLVPYHAGERGNPIMFAARHVPEICAGTLDVGCRRLIDRHPELVARVDMASEAYVRDCDTPEDYAALVAHLADTAV